MRNRKTWDKQGYKKKTVSPDDQIDHNFASSGLLLVLMAPTSGLLTMSIDQLQKRLPMINA